MIFDEQYLQKLNWVELVQLTLEKYACACSPGCSRESHEWAMKCRAELLGRLKVQDDNITALKSALNLQQTATIDAGAFADGIERENAKLRAENEKLLRVKEAAIEALKEIAKGADPFSRDPLTHASNTIEVMKEKANKALAAC